MTVPGVNPTELRGGIAVEQYSGPRNAGIPGEWFRERRSNTAANSSRQNGRRRVIIYRNYGAQLRRGDALRLVRGGDVYLSPTTFNALTGRLSLLLAEFTRK